MAMAVLLRPSFARFHLSIGWRSLKANRMIQTIMKTLETVAGKAAEDG
jgi:hypothetical protein